MIYVSYPEEDYTKIKQYMPAETSVLSQLITEACDSIDYEGSRIYDEFPDRNMMNKMCDSIYEKYNYQKLMPEEESPFSNDVFSLCYMNNSGKQTERLVKSLIMSMLCMEIYSRRCCRNCCKN